LSIELRHIKYFIAVAEELNFSRAAARLHIAQPPLSVQIQDLERRLGVQLFDRSGRRTALTPEGEVFLMEVREIIDQVSRASHAVNQVAHGELGRLRVTGISSAFPTVLAEIVPGFRAEHPNIVLDLREYGTQQGIDALHAGSVDVAFVRLGSPVDGLEIEEIQTSYFEAVVPFDHGLAGKSSVDLAELAAEPAIVTARHISPYYYDSTIAAFANAGVSPRTVVEATSIAGQLNYVACGMGVSLVPATFKATSPPRVRWIPLRQSVVSTELAIAWASGHTSRILDRFLQFTRQSLECTRNVAANESPHGIDWECLKTPVALEVGAG
jgi:DNA-binding transcriptional LysR family regulator